MILPFDPHGTPLPSPSSRSCCSPFHRWMIPKVGRSRHIAHRYTPQHEGHRWQHEHGACRGQRGYHRYGREVAVRVVVRARKAKTTMRNGRRRCRHRCDPSSERLWLIADAQQMAVAWSSTSSAVASAYVAAAAVQDAAADAARSDCFGSFAWRRRYVVLEVGEVEEGRRRLSRLWQ